MVEYLTQATPNPITIDWEIYRVQKLPGPGQYEPRGPHAHINGGKISESKPKSDIDWMRYRASKIPGPGMTRDITILLDFLNQVVENSMWLTYLVSWTWRQSKGDDHPVQNTT